MFCVTRISGIIKNWGLNFNSSNGGASREYGGGAIKPLIELDIKIILSVEFTHQPR